jgi:hypothetical protein
LARKQGFIAKEAKFCENLGKICEKSGLSGLRQQV